MRALSKALSAIAIVAAVALTASAADARTVNTGRFAGAYNSVSTPRAAGSFPYHADGAPFPSGHGSTGSSVDFQLVR